jgi:cell division protein FtsB
MRKGMEQKQIENERIRREREQMRKEIARLNEQSKRSMGEDLVRLDMTNIRNRQQIFEIGSIDSMSSRRQTWS